ncbi:MAG TPA: rhomboid family intramembrane serine protease [Thermoanaerobaculia bacterium]|nr:rhomboid family intramembrane serine protease [Thermoanaerobaculia bacterium]
MFRRQRSGSVLCPSCGRLVGVSDEVCYNCGRKNPGMWGFSGALRGLGQDLGFDKVVIGGSVLLYLMMLVVDPGSGLGGRVSLFSLLPTSPEAQIRFGASGAYPVFGAGRWWTVLSAGWLHANFLHVFFNVLWILQLAPQTAEFYGASRMVILYTASSAVGFGLSTLMGVPLTLGASAPIFGLLAALVYYGRRTGSSAIRQQAWYYAIVLFILGFLWSGVDNWAHAGGFAGGYLAALWLDPRRPERGNHTALAIVCLAATLAAIVASLVIPLPL